MKTVLASISAATVGVLAGFMLFGQRKAENLSETPKIRELTLLDEKGRTAATLSAFQGEAKLRFYSGGEPALDVGVSGNESRFVRFLGKHGRVLAALNSGPPNGEATLYLGDERWETRVILGALRSDVIPTADGVEEWGLKFRKPGSSSGALIQMLVESASDPSRATATIRLVRPDGSVWTK